MLNMVQRQDIISMYEATGFTPAVARELGMSRKTVKAYVNEYVAAHAKGVEALDDIGFIFHYVRGTSDRQAVWRCCCRLAVCRCIHGR